MSSLAVVWIWGSFCSSLHTLNNSPSSTGASCSPSGAGHWMEAQCAALPYAILDFPHLPNLLLFSSLRQFFLP